MAFGLDHIIVNDIDAATNPGRSLSSQALVKGKTVLVAEAGRSGVVAPRDVDALVDGSLNVLGELEDASAHGDAGEESGLAAGRVAAHHGEGARRVLRRGRARHAREERDRCSATRPIFSADRPATSRAPIDGLVTFIRGVPSMWTGATLGDHPAGHDEARTMGGPEMTSTLATTRDRDHASRFSRAVGSCAAHLALARRVHAARRAARVGTSSDRRRRRARAVRKSREGQRRRVGARSRRRSPATARRCRTAASSRAATPCWRSKDSTSRRAPRGSPAKRGSSPAGGRRTSRSRTTTPTTRTASPAISPTPSIRWFGRRERTRDLVVERNKPADASRIAAVRGRRAALADRRDDARSRRTHGARRFRAAATRTATSRSSSTIRASCSAAICSGTRCSRTSSTRCRRSSRRRCARCAATKDTTYVPGHGADRPRRRVRPIHRDARRGGAGGAESVRRRNAGRGRRRGVHAARVARRMAELQQVDAADGVRGVVQGAQVAERGAASGERRNGERGGRSGRRT